MPDVVLPGELVDAKHPNLKLGPGLLQLSDGSTISTKAGTLYHNQSRSKWWVESNSRRVCTEHQSHFRVFTMIYFSTSLPLRSLSSVSSSVKVVRRASESISAVHTTPTSTHSPLRVLQNGTGQISRWANFVLYFIFADFPRSDLCCMRAFLCPTKIWNRRSNASMHKPVNQQVSVNSKAGLSLDVA